MFTGKDENGRIWFKSDTHLTDITEAHQFQVHQRGLWKKTWYLIATFVRRPAYYQDETKKRGYVPAITEEKIIGSYTRETFASLALDELLDLKKLE